MSGLVATTTCLLFLVPASNAAISNVNIKTDQTTIGGNDDLDAYVGTGGLLLPSSFTGSKGSRAQISHCLECTWKYTVYCQSSAPGLCAHAVSTCQAGKIRYRVWFGRTAKSVRVVGSVCMGRGKPATRREIEHNLKQHAIRYVPPLQPGIAPSKLTLQSVPIWAWSGQHSKFVPAPMQLSGRKVFIKAKASWLWDWGDGTRQWSNFSGNPYPHPGILHRYQKSGHYTVKVTTVWLAQFTVEGIGTFDASGQVVTQQKSLAIRVKATKSVLTVPNQS